MQAICLEGQKLDENYVFSYYIYQGWPTSQMPRAAFLAVFQQQAISYTQGIMIALASPHLLLIPILCLARIVVYRPVSSVCNDIAIGADGLGFVAWAVWAKVDKVSPPLRHFFEFEAVLPKVLKFMRTLVLPRRKAAEIITQMVEW